MNTPFNKSNEYKTLLADKILDIKKICHIHKIPMFITVCVVNTENESIYEKEMISAATCGCELADNQIAKHVNVTLGFDTVQHTPEMTLDMDEIGSDYIEDNKGAEDDE